MFEIAKTHEDKSHPHAVQILNNFQGYTIKTLKKLEAKNYITINGKMWSMTKKGYAAAGNLYNQNLNDE